MLEIERKFLVTNTSFISQASSSQKIVQGYLCSDPKRTVRVRTKNNKAFITIKGETSPNGLSRFEWEKEITLPEALDLLKLCEHTPIQKTRYLVPFQGFTFEVDVFEGKNKGIILAELELSSENKAFPTPPWLGQEVTGNHKYYNSYMSKQ